MAFVSAIWLPARSTAVITCKRGRKSRYSKKTPPPSRKPRGSIPSDDSELTQYFSEEPARKPLLQKKNKEPAGTSANKFDFKLAISKETVQAWVTRATWTSVGGLALWFVLVHTVIVGDWVNSVPRV